MSVSMYSSLTYQFNVSPSTGVHSIDHKKDGGVEKMYGGAGGHSLHSGVLPIQQPQPGVRYALV